MERRRLLIVDDQVELLVALKQFFERRNYQVWVATTGEGALQVMKQHQPHAVLLERHFGSRDLKGFELLGQIQQGWPHSIVLLLEKPFSIAAVVGMLQQALGDGR